MPIKRFDTDEIVLRENWANIETFRMARYLVQDVAGRRMHGVLWDGDVGDIAVESLAERLKQIVIDSIPLPINESMLGDIDWDQIARYVLLTDIGAES